MQAMAVYNFTYVILLRMLGYLKDLFDSLHVAADFTGAIYIYVYLISSLFVSPLLLRRCLPVRRLKSVSG